MKTLNYYIYDLQNGINNKDISIDEFLYDENTLVFDFYNKLLGKYVEIKYNDATCLEDLYEKLWFNIVDNINGRELRPENGNEYLLDLIGDIKDNLLCILPKLPVGATFAMYGKDKIIIHSNEGNHLHFPHVHVIASTGMDTVISLDTFEICEGVELVGKEKKKIINYLKEKQDFLKSCYNQIVEHKVMDKITIDVID